MSPTASLRPCSRSPSRDAGRGHTRRARAAIRRLQLLVYAVACTLLAGCSGAASSPTQIVGHLGLYQPHLSIDGASTLPFSPASSQAGLTHIVISSRKNACAEQRASTAIKSSDVLDLALFDVDSAGNVHEADQLGTYHVVDASLAAAQLPAGLDAQVVFYNADAACVPHLQTLGTSGSVQLTGYSGGSYQGTFAVLFSGDPLSGTFDAPDCTPAHDEPERCAP